MVILQETYRIQEVVEHELSHKREIANVDACAFEVVLGSRAEAVRAQVAQAVYGGLGQ